MRTIPILTAVMLCCGPASATPLSKEDHAFLVNQTAEGCLSGQAREAANKNLTVAKIQDFCACFGEGLISTMTVEDLAKNQDTPSAEMTKASGTVFNSCAVTIFKK
jgi:hypothetical protein